MNYPRTFLISMVIFLPLSICFLFLSTFVHEQAHVDVAKEQGVNFKISRINYAIDFNNPNDWGRGFAIPSSEEDCMKVNSLPRINQQKITHAGVIRQMFVFVPLFIIAFLILILFRKEIFVRNISLFFILCMFLLLFGVIIINSIYGNVFLKVIGNTGNPTDWFAGNFSNCSMFG